MLDFVDLEADLDTEERMIRDAARAFVDDWLRPSIADHYEAGRHPDGMLAEMGDRGFLGANLDGDSLPGVGERAYGLVMQELEAGDSAARSAASVQGSLVMWPIHAYGTTDQRDRWLGPLSTGEVVGCFGLTEPEHGSNPAAMDTRAEPEGDGYRLRGTKTWITNAPIADLSLVWARDAGLEDAPVRGFLVETDRAGVDVSAIDGKLSMRASATGEIALDAWVPDDAVLPGVEGMRGPLSCLTQARVGVAWGAVGAARDCFEVARTYALDREQFGRPIAGFQLQQSKLAEMATGITTAQLLAHRLAELKDRGALRPAQASMAKRHNVAVAREVAATARSMLGGNGITLDYSPMRHLANLETVSTYEGTHDIHTLVLGEELTGIGAFE